MEEQELFEYTESLEKLLQNQHYGEEEQTSSLTAILGMMAKFPNFVFGDGINISMKDLFMERYKIREICCKNEDKFMHYWAIRISELIVKYVPKIQMWLDNFKELFKFTVTLDIVDQSKYSNAGQNTYYLNPVNANTEIEKTVVVDQENNTTTTIFSGGKLKTQDLDTKDENGQTERRISKDVLQSVWGKTRAALLAQILDLKDIYNECVFEFETIFYGVL